VSKCHSTGSVNQRAGIVDGHAKTTTDGGIPSLMQAASEGVAYQTLCSWQKPPPRGDYPCHLLAIDLLLTVGKFTGSH